jgi:rhomboid protease GluP
VEQEILDTRLSRRKPRLTHGLCAALVVAFGASVVMVQGQPSVLEMIRIGGLVPSLVESGQWWRLVASGFLHTGVPHLLVNCFSLFFLGGLMERTLGASRLAVIYTVSALAGSVASMMFMRSLVSVGASAAIFGLLGSLAVINWRWRGHLLVGVAQSRRWWFFIVTLNVALPVAMPQIDFMAHLWGFAAGAAATWLMVRGEEVSALPFSTSAPIRISAAACAALLIGGLIMAIWHCRGPQTEEQLSVARWILENPSSSPEKKNNVSWAVATDGLPIEEGQRDHWFDLAHSAMTVAISEKPEIPNFHDTLSHILFEIGRLDEAVAAEERAIELAVDDKQIAEYQQFLAVISGEQLAAEREAMWEAARRATSESERERLLTLIRDQIDAEKDTQGESTREIDSDESRAGQ